MTGVRGAVHSLVMGRSPIRWYSDGSKTTEGAGAGVFGP